MQKHIVSSYDEELSQLKSHLLTMGSIVEGMLKDSHQALLNMDLDLAQSTINLDTSINDMEVEGDKLCMNIFVRRQPAASDLRFIVSVSKILTELERMGDLSAGIAARVVLLDSHPTQDLGIMPILFERTERQLSRALTALAQEDIKLAMTVLKKEHSIDETYRNVKQDMLSYIHRDASLVDCSLILANIAKLLERIGDHATNIAEMVIYFVKAKDVRHIEPKDVADMIKNHSKT
ncbi:MAG: phosphate signaling complex protein PhoU [Mariprofundaceae bacterium]|nr:phosphate signaling complex protein PhoU [Mariprofundaceae bacterium]